MRSQRHRAYDRIVCAPVFVGVDALSGRVLVDEAVVRGSVRGVGEDMGGYGVGAAVVVVP